MLILNNDEIQRVLQMKDCIQAMEAAFGDLSTGAGINRPRSHTYVPLQGGPEEDRFYMFKSMDGALPRFGMHGLRISSDMLSERYFKGKRRREKLPAAPGGKYVGLLLLFSLNTLEPLAIMPDGYLQRTRVGATSAVAAKFLAKKDVRSACLIGSGWQAGSQLMGLYGVFPHLAETRVYSINEDHKRSFVEEWSKKLNPSIRAADTARAAVEGADVVALATNSQTPVLEGKWLKRGCHVNSVQGAELDDETMARADLLVLREKNEPTFWVMGEKVPFEVSSQQSIQGGNVDHSKIRLLGDIVSGKAAGRANETQITLFTGSGRGGSAGQGTQFVAVGAMIYKRAKEIGIGREIPTDWFLQDFKP
jgi:alanine dehydrogenase